MKLIPIDFFRNLDMGTAQLEKEIMKLEINGNDTEITDGLTVTGLLEELEIDPGRVAVEVNLKVIKRCDLGDHQLNDGDTVEIVNFVGGG